MTYFSYNAFLREYIAAMMMHKKFHLIAAGILCFPWIAAALLLACTAIYMKKRLGRD